MTTKNAAAAGRLVDDANSSESVARWMASMVEKGFALPVTLPDAEGVRLERFDTTVVITSCNRHDLLDRTLASFRALNTYDGIREIIVVEDGDADPTPVCEKHGARAILCGERIGQAQAIDRAYSEVTTPYIFHCEDDWEFYAPGFIEASRRILDVDPSTVVVWLRAWDNETGHPLSFRADDGNFGVLAFGYLGGYHGFTFNPGLRRLYDYQRLGSFARLDPDRVIGWAEAQAGAIYYSNGYRAVILKKTGYVRHLGGDRHVSSI